MLYVGTGDANVPYIAQDLSHPNGKVLRRADGKVPPDNLFPGSAVWAYGFRNISGLSFHPGTGERPATGRRVTAGEPKYMDSVYVVQKGRNHGWPLHLGVSNDGNSCRRSSSGRTRRFRRAGRCSTPEDVPSSRGTTSMTSPRSELMHRVDVGLGNSIRAPSGGGRKSTGRLAIAHGPDGRHLRRHLQPRRPDGPQLSRLRFHLPAGAGREVTCVAHPTARRRSLAERERGFSLVFGGGDRSADLA